MAWMRVAEVAGEGLGCRGAVTAAGQKPRPAKRAGALEGLGQGGIRALSQLAKRVA